MLVFPLPSVAGWLPPVVRAGPQNPKGMERSCGFPLTACGGSAARLSRTRVGQASPFSTPRMRVYARSGLAFFGWTRSARLAGGTCASAGCARAGL